jgi:hypothetical protein
MSGMNLGDILDILAERFGEEKLKHATYTARCIVELSRAVTDSVAQECYNKGYEEGQEFGRREMTPDRWEMDKYQRVYDACIRRANDQVADIVQRFGKDKKIQCIKELRSITGLGLKDTKDIVDAYVLKLNEAEEAERREQQSLMDAAQEEANFMDEPPF